MTTLAAPQISPLGDAALILRFGDDINAETHESVVAFATQLDSTPPPAMVEYVPAFTTITVVYDPLVRTYEEFAASMRRVLAVVTRRTSVAPREPVEIRVCYSGDLGPDLEFVAAHNDLTTEEVITIHSGAIYDVYMIGFAPGFPYLGGMSSRVAAPRLDTPRAAVPAGSVGIAGIQTGIYSIETPGGWRLIGRTPARLFRAEAETPSLLEPGDRVRFVPMTRAEYDRALSAGDGT